MSFQNYHFEEVYQYTKDLIEQRYHVVPKTLHYSIRNGFTLTWDNYTLEVTNLFISNMVLITIKDLTMKENATAFNMKQLYTLLTRMITTLRPAMRF